MDIDDEEEEEDKKKKAKIEIKKIIENYQFLQMILTQILVFQKVH
jgi:hypothetical protein